MLKYWVISPGVLFTEGCKCDYTYDRSYDRPFHHGSYVAQTNVLNLVVNLRRTPVVRQSQI